MFKIISTTTGAEIGRTDKPYYIKRTASGSLAPTEKDEAAGVSFKSTPYNLAGTDGVGADEGAVVVECDAGEGVAETMAAAEQNRADIDFIAMETGVELE